MTNEITEQDKRCHICQSKTDWILNVHFDDQVHVTVALCDRHRPIFFEILHAENEGIIELEVDKDKLGYIQFGEKKKTGQFIGPDLGELQTRRYQ